MCLETLVSCGLCGPTSPLAFGESVLGTVSGRVEAVGNKEHLWRMWSVVVNPLTDTITQVRSVCIVEYTLQVLTLNINASPHFIYNRQMR